MLEVLLFFFYIILIYTSQISFQNEILLHFRGLTMNYYLGNKRYLYYTLLNKSTLVKKNLNNSQAFALGNGAEPSPAPLVFSSFLKMPTFFVDDARVHTFKC